MSSSLLERAVAAVGAERVFASLSPAERERLKYEWRAWARPEQLAPACVWLVWLILAGRGFGKTRTGAEWVREEVQSGRRGRLALVAPTAADARDVMVEGESGVLATSPRWFKPTYEPSKRRITWPNGALATLYSADEPERLRGPQHDGAWCDEIAAWRYADAWDMLLLGLRLGEDPRIVATTTPKPIKLVRDLIKTSTTAVTRGSTYDNAANLAKPFLEAIKAKYEGTRLGRQELYAEILDEVPGALWQRGRIDQLRVDVAPDLARVAVAVDPSGGAGEGHDAQGIVVSGLGVDRQGYVLADRTLRGTPDQWGRAAVQAYVDFDADVILGERNFGGDMVKHVIETAARAMGVRNVHYRDVVASRGKVVRAEPVAALYEQGKVHHVRHWHEKPTQLEHLEDELCRFVPGELDASPNRADALVWGLTELMVGPVPGAVKFRDAMKRQRAA